MDSNTSLDTNENIETPSDVPQITDLTDSFSLETRGQIADGIDSLRQISEIHPEQWETIQDANERLAALQNVEENMASIQGRPSVPVEAASMEDNVFGGWNGQTIRVNYDHLMGDQTVMENVDTIVHEGRHAYQDYAIEHPEIISDQNIIQEWKDNMQDYKNAETYGLEIHLNQPVEADAWSYANSIQSGLYGDMEN
jgi:hypothetical protein